VDYFSHNGICRKLTVDHRTWVLDFALDPLSIAHPDIEIQALEVAREARLLHELFDQHRLLVYLTAV
jgi:hypothetical protein